MPTVTDPNNPLGLTVAAPGYLPPDQRAPVRDPDLGWSDGMQVGGPGVPLSSLPVDTQNSVTAAQQNWADMDRSYYAAREQDPLPLVLGAAGLIAAPFALGALGVGAGAAGAGAGAAGGASTAGALGAGAAGAGTAAGLGTAAGFTVPELVVSAAGAGLSVPAIAAATGLTAAGVTSILAQGGSPTVSSAGGDNALTGSAGGDTVPASTVPELTVQAPAGATSAGIPAVLGGAGVAGAGGLAAGASNPSVDEMTVTAQPGGDPASKVSPLLPPAIIAGSGIAGLMGAISSGSPSNIGDWIKANPAQAAALGLGVAGVVGSLTGSGTPSGDFSIPTGDGAPGTLSSLAPNFSAALPAPTNAPHTLRPLPQGVNWNRYAIDGPSQSFFTDVPQSPAPQFAVMSRSQTKQNAADRLGLPDIASLTAKFAGPGYAKGGRMDFAVHGAGDGRSDSIPARLSDGEYVMDAETVSMLGDGSSKAGAKKLDRMRVNLRKAKGKQLARGRFSVTAKDPEHYYRGGRTDA